MTTYVCGHRNPDTDSIVSAMAYANLCNALGDNGYIPARLGHLNDETTFLLKKFRFEPPLYLHTVRTQVKDIDFDRRYSASACRSAMRGICSKAARATMSRRSSMRTAGCSA